MSVAQLLPVAPDPRGERADQLIRQRRYEEAIRLCKQAPTTDVPTRLLLSRALIALHRDREAAAELSRCLVVDRQCSEAYRLLGQLALRHNDCPQAIDLFTTASRLTPHDESLRTLIAVTRGMAVRASVGPVEEVTQVLRADAIPVRVVASPTRRARRVFWLSLVLAVASGTGALLDTLAGPPRPQVRRAMASPPAPPVVPQWASSLAADSWLHPLAGPMRRMPTRDSRTFGAERPGDRPADCRSGHCGVDLGETWGEPVLAAHEGVIDRVQRGPNPDRGGLYVRVAHRGGTVITEYFHLAAIPHALAPGRPVKAGDVIGIVGDTGVRQSGPHLHFALIIKTDPGDPGRYVDPEPLVALWPLRTPSAQGAILDAAAATGVPRGPLAVHKRKHRRARR